MIVSIAETIKHQEPERRLFLKKNDGEAENRKIRVIIPRERLPFLFQAKAFVFLGNKGAGGSNENLHGAPPIKASFLFIEKEEMN